jgi:hypothetical protein
VIASHSQRLHRGRRAPKLPTFRQFDGGDASFGARHIGLSLCGVDDDFGAEPNVRRRIRVLSHDEPRKSVSEKNCARKLTE